MPRLYKTDGEFMKLLYVITLPDLGGAQAHLLEVARAMVADGHEVYVAVGKSGWLTEQLAELQINTIIVPELVREISPVKDYRVVCGIKKIIQNIRPDIVHCHSSKAGIVGRVAAWLAGVPAVFTAHGWAFTEGVPAVKRLVYSLIEHTMLLCTDKVLCVSEYDHKLADKWFGYRSEKLVTVYNGVANGERSAIPSDMEKGQAELQTKELSLIMVARFAPPKEHLQLVKAAEQVLKSGYAVRCNLVGDGPLMAECAEYVRQHNLSSQVKLLGARNDVSSLLHASDVFCLISNYEGLPISIIEGMRADLPVLASNVGGVPELVEDGVNGFLINRGDIKQLAEKIICLLKDKKLLMNMGKKSREIYLEKFTSKVMIDKIKSVYNEILQ